MNRCTYEIAHGTLPDCDGKCSAGKFGHCSYYYVDPLCTLIKEWKREACVEDPVLIKKNSKDHMIMIYTTKPGYFIGYQGELYKKYNDKFKETNTDNDYCCLRVVECQDVVY